MKRRELLALGGTALGTWMAGTALPSVRADEDGIPVWNYEPLDPAAAAQRAYDLYADGSCMYASFRAIVEMTGEKRIEKHPLESAQWRSFPYYMMAYGKGGIHDYGSLCGTLNGGAAAISLFVTDRKDAAALTYELLNFYESTALPVFVPAVTKFSEITQSVSESVLCHVSVSRWAAEADETAESPRRKERCKRLVGDVVTKTVEILNRYFAAGKKCPAGTGAEVSTAWGGTTNSLAEPAVSCVACHNPEGEQPRVNVKMNCAACHDMDSTHGSK